jgi:hypothetical protein
MSSTHIRFERKVCTHVDVAVSTSVLIVVEVVESVVLDSVSEK